VNTSDSAAAGHSPLDAAQAQPFRVLLVEDNPINQRLMRRVLENLHCQVDIAANGQEAVAKHAPGRYEVIFMDCHMPIMDGFDATTEIRRTEASDQLPIIAVTASIVKSDHERCRQVGMDSILTKPVDPEEIRTALSRLSRRPAPSLGRAPEIPPAISP
jgi:CheY-like chemotaxis protein